MTSLQKQQHKRCVHENRFISTSTFVMVLNYKHLKRAMAYYFNCVIHDE